MGLGDLMKKASSYFKSKSFGTKIFLIFVLMLVVLVFFFSTLLYRYFYKSVEESVIRSIGDSISANEQSAKSILNRIDIASDMICDANRVYTDIESLPRVFQYIYGYKTPADADEVLERIDELKTLQALLDSYMLFLSESGKQYECVLYIDEAFDLEGFLPQMRIENTPNNDINIYSSKKITNQAWYQQIRDSDNMEFTVSKDEQRQKIHMYRPLVCRYIPPHEYEVVESRLGALYVSFDAAWITRSIAYSSLTPRASVYLVDKNGQIICSVGQIDNIENVQKLLDEQLPKMQTGDPASISYDREMCIIQYNSLAENIGMVTVVPSSDVSQLVSRTISVIVTMTVVLLVFGILIIYLLSTYLIRPIKKLSEHMDAGSMEKVDCTGMGEDEIRSLYLGFNKLMDRINQLISDVYRETDEKHRAEMRALQAQINPHFVYNTLDMVCGRSLLRGETDVADILTSLSHIMRYSTKRPDDLVPLSQEIEIIKKYEVIQSACYENGICFEYVLDSEAMNILVPKLIIQPLVENAILYGMDIETRRSAVKVLITKGEDQVTIDVVDAGTDAQIEKMNGMLVGTMEEKSDSLGIRNVYERLKGVYGPSGNLVFLRNEDGNTVARITITDFAKERNDHA